MSATKPSGIPWLGEVPAHWEVKRLKDMCQLSALYGMNEPSSSYATEGIRFLRTTDITDDGDLLEGGAVYLEPEVVKDYMLTDGDILLSRSGTLGRSLVYREGIHSPCSYAGYLVRFVPGTNLDPQFAFYFTKSREFVDWLELTARASTIGNISGQKFANLPFPSPPLPEQRAIAAFLDERTARIDALVARKRRLVQLLKEKRQALITRAVTRGLEPKAKMKESGVPWLGEVPEGWEVKRLKYLLREPLQYGANEAAEQDEPDQPRFIRITDINEDGGLREETFRSLPEDVARPYLLEEGDVLFARSGATVGKTFLYTTAWGRAAYAGYLIRARLDERRALAKFIQWFTTSTVYWQWLESNTIQATIQNVSADKYNSLWVPVPPLDEQGVIVQTVQSQLSYIDALVTKVEQAMERLQEYRTALISAAVTGKVPPTRGATADKG